MKFSGAVALLLLGATFVTGNSALGAVSAASVAGTYSFVSQESGFVVGDRHSHLSGSTGTISFDGAGVCTFSYSGTGYDVASDGQGATAVVGSAVGKTATTCTYTVSPTGTLDVSADTDSFSFALSPDSNFFTTGSALRSDVGGIAGLSAKQMVAVKRGSSLGNASLTGTYSFVDQQLGFRQSVPGAHPSDVMREVAGSLVFDGNGGCTMSTEGEEFFHDISFAPNMLSTEPAACSYSVSSTGLVTLTTPSGTSNLFLTPDAGTLIGGGAEAKNQDSLCTKLVAVKAASDMTVADLDGKYNFSYQEAVFYEPKTSDGSELSSLDKGISGGNGQMEFDGDGGCSFTYSGQGLGNSQYLDLPGSEPILCSYSVSPDGRVDVDLTTGTTFTFWLQDSLDKAIGGTAAGYSTTVGNVYRVRQLALAQPTFIAAAPASISVPGAADGSYQVSWSASTTEGVVYVVQEATNEQFAHNVLEYRTAYSYLSLTNKSTGSFYYYRVKAVVDGYTDSDWTSSATGCAVPGTPVPTIGTLNVPAQSSDGNFTVTWSASAVNGVTYVLQEATDPAFTTGVREAYQGAATSTGITGRVTGTTYYYRVKASAVAYEDSSWQTSGAGCTVVAAPPAAAPLTITVPAADPDGSYTVTWGASATKGATYLLQEASDAAFTRVVQEYQVATLSKLVTGKQLGNQYYYRVKAVHASFSDSAWKTAAAPCAVPGTILTTLTTLTVPIVDANGSYTVSWNAAPAAGATYVLQQATNATFTAGVTESYRGTDTSASISGGATGTTYFYRVKAVKNGYKDAAWKPQAVGCKVIGIGVPAAAPLTLTVPAGDPDGNYAISWGASATKGVTYVLQEATDAAFTENVQEFAVSGLKQPFVKPLGTTYYYRVKAVHPEYAGSAWKTAAAGCAVPGTLLATLTSLTVPTVDADGSYTVTWSSSVTGGVTYVLQQATNAAFTAGLTEAYRGSATSASISGGATGITYFYRVKAVKIGYKDGAWKTQTIGCKVIGLGVPAAAPLTITVPAGDVDGGYTVSWGASATKGVTYLLQEATDAAFTLGVQEYAVSGLLKATTGKSLDTTYYYRVKAVHPEYSDSAWKTAAISCAVPGTLLVAPTTLTASVTQVDGSYDLSWSASLKAGVTYVLQEATNSSFTTGVSEAYRGEAVTATITGRTPGVSYYYRVKVVKTGSKDSAWKVMTGFKKLPL